MTPSSDPAAEPARRETSADPAAGSARPEAFAALDVSTAEQALHAQPFSKLLGTRLRSFGDGESTLELDIREDLLQQNGFVHGGVLSYAADNAITFAAGTALGAAVLTSGYSIQYIRPAVGSLLRARAEVVHAGRRQAVVRCEVLTVAEDGTQSLCAVAQGTVLSAGRP
ncbi:PaaI family thioesterase [Streptomyces sp. NPDC058739]|uniref:PaaI family thioesterase n=1 Tax=Streptomyces sp. NPDC058739 TaxID=3346618 RepID=UPI0036A40164